MKPTRRIPGQHGPLHPLGGARHARQRHLANQAPAGVAGICHATEPPDGRGGQPPAGTVPPRVARPPFRVPAGGVAAAATPLTRIEFAVSLRLDNYARVQGAAPERKQRKDMAEHVAAIRAAGITPIETARFEEWLTDYGWDRDGQWLGLAAAFVQRYGDTPLNRAVATAPDLFTALERIQTHDPTLGAALAEYLWESNATTPPPRALRAHPGLMRRLAMLIPAYSEPLEVLLGHRPEEPQLDLNPWRDIVTTPRLTTAHRALVPLAAQFRTALADLDPVYRNTPLTLPTLRALDRIIRQCDDVATVPALADVWAASPLAGAGRVAEQLRAIHARRWTDSTTADLPAVPGLFSVVNTRLWRTARDAFPTDWEIESLLTEHLRATTPPLPEMGLTDAERAWQIVPLLQNFTARIGTARDLLDLASLVAEAPIRRVGAPYHTTREELSDRLRDEATGREPSPLDLPETFGIAARADLLRAQMPPRTVTAAEQRAAANRESVDRSHRELFARLDALGDATGRIGIHPAAAIRTIVADLLAGEFISLLEVPNVIRTAIEAHLRNVIAVAQQIHPAIMQPEDGRNPLTQEWLRGNIAAQYRLARMTLDGCVERGALPPPPIHLARRAREFARDHLQWAEWAHQPFTTVVEAVRRSFEEKEFIPWAEQFWQTADPQSKRLARELYFHRQLYREVPVETAYRLWSWIGANGCIGEFGVVRSPRLGRDRRLVARGDLFNVAPSIDGEVEAHTHPQFLQFTDRDGKQGIAGMTVALDHPNLTPSPSTHPILPSEGDLEYIHGIGHQRHTRAKAEERTWNGRVTHALLHEHGGTLIVHDYANRRFDLYFARNPANPGDEEWSQQSDRLQAWALDPGGAHQSRRPFTVAFHGIAYANLLRRLIPARKA